MIPISVFANQKVAVFGLARTGIAAALALKAGGANVLAWDDGEASRQKAMAAGVELTDLNNVDFEEIDALLLSPGVPLYGPKEHWSAAKAKEAGVEIISDVELMVRALATEPAGRRSKIIAITGTNGKSTTTALIAHILATNGVDVRMGGNIGTGVLSLPPPRKGAVYVLELSSYQLDIAPSIKPDVAIQLNLTEDHIERHGTMARYAKAKASLFAHLDKSNTAIIGVDDYWGQSLCTHLMAAGKTNIVPISIETILADGLCLSQNKIYSLRGLQPEILMDFSTAITLPGRHNGQNAAAAFAAGLALGLRAPAIAAAILSFPGLDHRLQKIGEYHHAGVYNDSKATNADASAQALNAFEKIRWLVGGQGKTGGIDSLFPLFNRVEKAYCFGHSGPEFAASLSGVAYEIFDDLASATKAALADCAAANDGVPVVLSPAAASFDAYSDFEARGADFVRIVQSIINPDGAFNNPQN